MSREGGIIDAVFNPKTHAWTEQELNGRHLGNGNVEVRCMRCGIYFARAFWFQGNMPRDEALRYCRPCLVIVDFEHGRLLECPFKTPKKRPAP